ncbi:MAG TPA: hypothetical protein VG870_00680 [Chitinophagaceae bacterium]|nr:hypothetical protein [Chitinophagaceae bacterium]
MIDWKKYYLKLYGKQWIVGIGEGSLEDIIRTRQFSVRMKWICPADNQSSYADPFVYRTASGLPGLLLETVSNTRLDGRIDRIELDAAFEPTRIQTALDFAPHLSYPHIFQEGNLWYVFPESAHAGQLFGYSFDPLTGQLSQPRQILPLPVLDATLLQYEGSYWLFGTLAGPNKHGELHIYYSDSLFGPYKPHAGNPVRRGLNGTRPAGNFISVDGGLYRPAQNCARWYGESLTVNRVLLLNENEFKEEPYLTINPAQLGREFFGIHTLNGVGNYIVVDALRGRFLPGRQLWQFVSGRLFKRVP